jgi:outer membrane protein TolC
MLSPLQAGVPSELLRHRPDVRQAELELKAAGLEVKVAAARFYPAMNVSAVLGIESFTMGSPILAKENLAYGATANLAGPLINRSAIKAAFKGASARQVAAVYRYQQTVLKAYVEVVNALSQVRNLGQGYELKSRQVEALSDAATMSAQLFNSARADYTEVLLTQREALESRVELVEMKQIQLMAAVKAYKALGGGVPDSRDDSATTPKATVKATGRPKS